MKVCRDCKIEKPYTEYSKEAKNSDGYRNQCKECKNVYMRNKRENPTMDDIAKRVYSGIKRRCTNEKAMEHRPKYRNVELLMSQKEFVEWYKAGFFEGCHVDRIDDDGNYCLSNIQLLSAEDHNRKRATKRIDLENNTCLCNRCKTVFEYTSENFYCRQRLITEYNTIGAVEHCRECNLKTQGART